ncbi:MAG: hypothetical protein IJ073_00980 [Lachnospiraceae bacterium]|nr:hypothetical protein [Lachnospiraceae bacterium]
MSFLSNAAQNSGNIEKAIIEIIDLRDRKMTKKNAVKVLGNAGWVGGFSGNAGSSFASKGALNENIKQALGGFGANEQVMDEAMESLSGKRVRYTVQFNPSSLRLSGRGGGLIREIDYGTDGKSASMITGETNIVMSVSLLFDSYSPSEFSATKISVTSVAKSAGRSVLSALGKKKTSVQKDVEAFIAALRNRFTRVITFPWGDINYSGTLRGVSAVYTMFNIQGEPVRANVELSIVCADEVTSPSTLSVWQERYRKSFEDVSMNLAGGQGTVEGLKNQGLNSVTGMLGGLL